MSCCLIWILYASSAALRVVLCRDLVGFLRDLSFAADDLVKDGIIYFFCIYGRGDRAITSGLALLSSSELCDVFIAIVIVQRATKILVKIGSARCYIDFNSWHVLELFYCCTYLGGIV